MLRILLTNLPCRYVKDLVSFAGDIKSNVVNLSRADPKSLELRGLKGLPHEKYQYIFHPKAKQPALCLMVGLIVDDKSKVLVANSAGIGSKFVSAIPLTYEYERFVASTAMVLGATSFKSQLTGNKLVFSTRPTTNASIDGEFCVV